MGGSEVRGSEEESDNLRTKVFQTKILHNICTTVSSVTPDISLRSEKSERSADVTHDNDLQN